MNWVPNLVAWPICGVHSSGEHPLVPCVLKGAFNEFPPQQEYFSFLDMSQVLIYLL